MMVTCQIRKKMTRFFDKFISHSLKLFLLFILEPPSRSGLREEKKHQRRKRSLLLWGLTFIDLLHSGFITTALRPIMYTARLPPGYVHIAFNVRLPRNKRNQGRCICIQAKLMFSKHTKKGCNFIRKRDCWDYWFKRNDEYREMKRRGKIEQGNKHKTCIVYAFMFFR